MRYVVYGAGAIGGVVGGRLAQHGVDVVLVARGAHADAVERSGLRIDSPAGPTVLRVPLVRSPGEIDWRPDDVVLVAVKSQHSPDVLTELRRHAEDPIVVCLQNGVENERLALRLFARVYAVCVMCPAGHLEPGVVESYSQRAPGILDVGRYPGGVDAVADAVAADFRRGTFASWQSLQRRSESVETDLLNGEIVLLGRLHGVATPVNLALQQVGFSLAERRSGPGALDAGTILDAAR
jgi:2-dehydropantoate 2-reductase